MVQSLPQSHDNHHQEVYNSVLSQLIQKNDELKVLATTSIELLYLVGGGEVSPSVEPRYPDQETINLWTKEKNLGGPWGVMVSNMIFIFKIHESCLYEKRYCMLGTDSEHTQTLGETFLSHVLYFCLILW